MENTTATETQSPSLVQHALRFGAIMGAIGIVITLLLYAIDYTFLADWKVGIVMILVFLGFVIYAGINYRNEAGGYLSYGKAFQHGFITLAVGGLINVIFSGILYGVIDPELPQKLTDVAVENAAKMMQSFGAPESKIDEQVAKLKEDMPARFSFVGQLKGYFWGLIIYAIISLITALFVRKAEPEEM